MVGRTAAAERVRADIVRLVHRGLAVDEFARAATRVLRRAVPFDGTCLLTLDPATLLPTREVVENGLSAAATARLNEIELREPDVNKLTELARRRRPAAGLSEATAGDLDQSLRQRELRRPAGFGDELRAVLPDATGTWGALILLREASAPHFTSAEVRLVASLTQEFAEGVRRATLHRAAESAGGEIDGEPGLLVLAPDDTVEMSNPAAGRRLDELGTDRRAGAGLPVVVHAVARRARHLAEPDSAARQADTGVARARVRTRAGRWLVARGSVLGEHPTCRVAVLLEPARAPELAPLIVEGFGLTERERRITELVARGLSTNEISGRLHLSAYTVQDHLKAIFEKSGTGTRGELVARLFLDHHLPRLAAGPDPG